jgi:hypothetical protein
MFCIDKLFQAGLLYCFPKPLTVVLRTTIMVWSTFEYYENYYAAFINNR